MSHVSKAVYKFSDCLAVITVRDEGSGIPADFLPRITVRLVALTGYGQATDIAMALAAGFDAHLVKPIDAIPSQR